MIDRICFYLCISKLTQDSLMKIKKAPDVKNVSQAKGKNPDNPLDESGLNSVDPLVLERRYWKVEPSLIDNSIRLSKKYNSQKQSFLLEIFYIHGTEISTQNKRIRDMVGNFVESHVDRYSQAEISSTLQEILSISDDPCITWIDGEAFPLTNARNKKSLTPTIRDYLNQKRWILFGPSNTID